MLTLNKKCARCTRVDQQEISSEEVVRRAQAGIALEGGPAAVTISIRGTEMVKFEHLCPPCTEIVGSHVGAIGTVLEKQSSLRKRGE